MSVPDVPIEDDLERPSGSVSVLFSPTRTRVVLSGEIDDSLDHELTLAVGECRAARVPVDVDSRALAFLDSAGVAQLAHLARQLPVRLIQPPDTVRFVLSVAGLDSAIEVLEQCPAFPEPGPGSTGTPRPVVRGSAPTR